MGTNRVESLTRRILRVIRQNDDAPGQASAHPAVKELLVGVLKEEVSERRALLMLGRLERVFVDWNEVRISSLYEIAHTMDGSSKALQWAERVRGVLRRVFDKTNDLTLQTLTEMPRRESVRMVREFAAFPERRAARRARAGNGRKSPPRGRRVASGPRKRGSQRTANTGRTVKKSKKKGRKRR